MTAGLPSKVEREIEWKNQLGTLTEMPLVSQPGSTYLYSNFSYRMLGSVIQAVTTESYYDDVQSIILNPLHMNLTATTDALSGSGLLARPYIEVQGTATLREVKYKDPEISFSAGMLATNIDDMVKYVQAMLSRQILSPAGYQTLWYSRPPLTTGAPCNWAFGWGATVAPEYGGARAVAMNGGLAGVAATVIILPDNNGAVIALSNLGKPSVYAIAKKVARITFGKTGSSVESPSEEPASTPE
jgi:CubicO group peptidase (beta-lactamase class C family)